MLIIYHSNNLNILTRAIKLVVENKPLDNPFEPELVLVQSTGMTQWLKISMAQKIGILANFKFLLPDNFIWDIFRITIPKIPKQNSFSKQNMKWKLMTLLPQILQHKKFVMLQHQFNQDANKQKIFYFATCMANLYKQYLLYRPSWIIKWESDLLIEGLPEEQIWQAELWKELVKLTKKLKQPCSHYANLYDRFVAIMESKTKSPLGIPSRIFIYGISSLPPIYLNALKALSKHVDIYILFTNPCRYYWGNIREHNGLESLAIPQQDFCLFKERLIPRIFNSNKNTVNLFNKKKINILPNPLLVSWGKNGSDYIHMLTNISSSRKMEINAFTEIVPNTLLHAIQLDILNLENRAVYGISKLEFVSSKMKRKLEPNDRSITVHVCHSQQREVEVLHDQILAILQDNPDLSTRDIIVMAADIDSYIPFIQATFDSATGDRYIPYTISDSLLSKSHPIIQAFISLISLPDSRFFSEDVLELLEVPVLAARFNIDENGLQCLRQWVNESGVRWGLDDNNVEEFQLPVTGQHTWKFGLTRMMLGYAMESSYGEWKEFLPYDESNGLITELLGYLAELLTHLTNWRHKLKQPRSLGKWLPVYQEILNDFFLLDDEAEAAISVIECQWKAILHEGIVADYSEDIPFSLLRNELIKRLNKERINHNFLTGPVNICMMTPMRSIPFKVICLLGMNDDIYPRFFAPLNFDLMAKKFNRGDYSQRDNDRYLFLETLISAKQIFYISYIGYSIQNNRKRLPSVLIQELVDYIGQSYYLPGDEILNCDESEKQVKKHIVFYHSRMPFDPVNYEDNTHQSYAREWLSAAKREGIEPSNFIQELKPISIEIIKLEHLQRFWIHPIRAFFQQRLQVNFCFEEKDISNAEPFSIEGIDLYRLNQQLLTTLVEQKDTYNLFRRFRAAGQLPYGPFGKIIWQEQYQEMQEMANQIIKFYQPGKNIEINLNCDDIHLIGWIKNAQPNGLLRWRPSIKSISQGLQLWLEHLVYSASGNEGESILFMRQNSKWHFLSIDPKTAQGYLNLFVEGYCRGLHKPLILLPESGGAWIEACYNTKNHDILTDKVSLQKANSKFWQIYEGNMLLDGEGKDIWYRRLWNTIEPYRHFDIIIKEAKRYLLPMFKFRQK